MRTGRRPRGAASIRLREQELWIESWCRVVGGSGERHLVTVDDVALVESGFV